MRYAAHRRLIAPALPSAAFWRLLVGCVLLAVIFVLLSFVYVEICVAILPNTIWGPNGDGMSAGTTPWGALVNLFVFAMAFAALALVLPLVHGRGIGGIIGPAAPALAQARRVGAYILGVYLVISLLPMPEGMALTPALPLDRWLIFLPLTLLGLLVQVSAEEVIFRGYLQSQLAARLNHPGIWMIVPSILFGLLHYEPETMGGAAWVIVIWATLFGIAAADLTARSGTLGPAIALHLINNFSAIALVAPQGNLDGLALYSYPFGVDDTALLLKWLPVDLMVLFCSWLAARLALRV